MKTTACRFCGEPMDSAEGKIVQMKVPGDHVEVKLPDQVRFWHNRECRKNGRRYLRKMKL